MTRILKSKFSKNDIDICAKGIYASDWPVVYVLEGKKEAYIGETTSFKRRMKDHLVNPVRKALSDVYLIANDRFNKSATLDIESMLIEYMAADGKYKLQNNNSGIRNHNYYNRPYYRDEFEKLWVELQKIELAEHSLLEIRNSDLFKMSPFKRLTEDQYSIVKSIDSIINSQNTSSHIIHGEPGSGKTVLAVYMMKYLLESDKFANKRIGLVVPMTSLRNSIRKVFRSVKGLKANMVLSLMM